MQRKLFGGAMEFTCGEEYIDASQFRQVPDNQEVLVRAEVGASVIVELLDRQTIPDDEAISFFFHDLARSNAAVNCSLCPELEQHHQPEVVDTPRGQLSLSRILGCGTQTISKFANEEGSENSVFVAMGLLRIPPPFSTDVLLTVNAPQRLAVGSSEMRVVTNLLESDDALTLLRECLATLKVNDWGLFVCA